jgi:DMSO/TMAO reductase YedYZ molybdopterin-dependent catalytic subunit
MSVLSELGLPAFTAGGRPEVDLDRYTVTVTNLDGQVKELGLEEIKSLPSSDVDARLTSVSGFSVRALWQGCLWRDFLDFLGDFAPKAGYATFTSQGGGYDTTVALDDLDHPRTLLCWAVGGQPLEFDYGGPLRMVIPQLYGYKSAKWLAAVDFVDRMQGGYWEDRGYSRSGVIEPGHTLDLNTRTRRPISGGEVTDF